MESVYTFRSEKKPVQISFSLIDKEKNENIRDARAWDFLASNILKVGEDEAVEEFYLDDVQDIKEQKKK